MRKLIPAVVLILCAPLLSQGLAAQTSEVRVLASNGIKAVVQDLLPQSERAIGHTISVHETVTACDSWPRRVRGPA